MSAGSRINRCDPRPNHRLQLLRQVFWRVLGIAFHCNGTCLLGPFQFLLDRFVKSTQRQRLHRRQCRHRPRQLRNRASLALCSTSAPTEAHLAFRLAAATESISDCQAAGSSNPIPYRSLRDTTFLVTWLATVPTDRSTPAVAMSLVQLTRLDETSAKTTARVDRYNDRFTMATATWSVTNKEPSGTIRSPARSMATWRPTPRTRLVELINRQRCTRLLEETSRRSATRLSWLTWSNSNRCGLRTQLCSQLFVFEAFSDVQTETAGVVYMLKWGLFDPHG